MGGRDVQAGESPEPAICLGTDKVAL